VGAAAQPRADSDAVHHLALSVLLTGLCGHFNAHLRATSSTNPHFWRYACVSFYSFPGVAETLNMHTSKGHYYQSHPSIKHRPAWCRQVPLKSTGRRPFRGA